MLVCYGRSMTIVVRTQTLDAPVAITDPKQINSKQDARAEKTLSIEKLYMTRQVGRFYLVAGWKNSRFHQQPQRPQQHLAGSG